jgi:hypothetical protein
MTNKYIIGLILGLTSAVVFVSAATGPLLVRVALFLITALPVFLAGLGWGMGAALAAGLGGTLAVSVLDVRPALLFAASQALPALVLSHLAMLSREVAVAPDTEPGRQWYPPGRLVIAAALLSALPATLWLVMLGSDLAELKTSLEGPIGEFIRTQMPHGPDGAPLSDEDVKRITEAIVALLPMGSAMSWMIALLTNLWLAGRIMVASGHLVRPWPDLAAMTYPPGTPLALAATTAASLMGGATGLAASGFAGALFLAYVLLGLAVIHYVTRGSPWRPFLLWGLYATLLLASAPLSLPLALLGLAETFLHLRARFSAARSPPAT